MKKNCILLACIIVVSMLFTSCAREEFMDIYGFCERFDALELSPEDFYQGDTEGVYYTFFEKENPKIMLKLLCGKEEKIEEIRIYLPKYDENAHKKSITTDEIRLFVRIAAASVKAFTGCTSAQAEDTAEQMQLYQKGSYEKEGELTKTKDSFHFVYHSASLGSEFIVYNTYLKDVPTTEKPESRPMYGDTTKIRTETVPAK